MTETNAFLEPSLMSIEKATMIFFPIKTNIKIKLVGIFSEHILRPFHHNFEFISAHKKY